MKLNLNIWKKHKQQTNKICVEQLKAAAAKKKKNCAMNEHSRAIYVVYHYNSWTVARNTQGVWNQMKSRAQSYMKSTCSSTGVIRLITFVLKPKWRKKNERKKRSFEYYA